MYIYENRENLLSPHNWGRRQGFSRRPSGIFRRRLTQPADRRRELGQPGQPVMRPSRLPARYSTKVGTPCSENAGPAARRRRRRPRTSSDPFQQRIPVQQGGLLEDIAVVAVLPHRNTQRRSSPGAWTTAASKPAESTRRMPNASKKLDGSNWGALMAGIVRFQPWPADTTTNAGRSVRSAMA